MIDEQGWTFLGAVILRGCLVQVGCGSKVPQVVVLEHLLFLQDGSPVTRTG
jgi:hypothetical protein